MFTEVIAPRSFIEHHESLKKKNSYSGVSLELDIELTDVLKYVKL